VIIREAPVDNAWYRAAGTWFVTLFAINCLAWPVLDFYRYELARLSWIAFSIPLGSVILLTVGRIFGAPKRVTLFVTVIGLFGIIPLLLGSLLPIIVLLLFAPPGSFYLPAALALSLVLSAYWLRIQIEDLHKKIVSNRFIEREFRIGIDSIYLNRAPKTDLDDAPGNGWLRNAAGFPPLIFFLLTAGYPLQRLLFHSGGVPAVVFLLSILGTPLAAYIIGRTACGFYLWIYTVRKLELQHGKPVIFEEIKREAGRG
jgi:hypothetical protein